MLSNAFVAQCLCCSRPLTLYFQAIINTETRYVEVEGEGGYFAFRDQGAHLLLIAIKVETFNILNVYINYNLGK